MRILVVTDKYPPNVVGGAEVSLSLTLQALAKRQFEISVAVLDGQKGDEVRRDVTGGLDVWHLPELGQWPIHYPYPKAGAPPLSGMKGRLAWPVAALRYLGDNHSTLADRWKRVQDFRALSKSGWANWLPTFDDDLVPPSGTVEALKSLIETVKPAVIHADNHRSIMVSALSRPEGCPLVSMVRDHRFFCARREQDANVDGVPCLDCKFQCLKALPSDAASRAQDVMSEVMTFRRACLNASNVIVTTSRYLQDQQSTLMPDHEIVVAGNPADDAAWIDQIQADIDPARPAEILLVGMVNRNKGQARVVDWIRYLKQSVRDFRIVLAGRGGMVERLRREAQAAGVSDHLLTPGFLDREALYRAYARAHLVLAPSVWPEPFGRVPLEAGTSRRPVVAYDVGGLGESILDGKTGFVVPAGDEAALLERTSQLLQDRELSRSMGQAARDHILERYDLEKVADVLARVWRSQKSGES